MTVAPANSSEYRKWLQEQAVQLEDMLYFGDRLVREGRMSADLQGREGLEKVVDALYAHLQSMGMEVVRTIRHI